MIKRILVGCITISTLVGCTNANQDINKMSGSIDAAAIVADSKSTPADKAERLARSAEQLLSYQGFAYASDIAEAALELDPNNLRAKLVKAIVAPLMAHKGIIARVAPLAAKNQKAKEAYDKYLADLDTTVANSTLKAFLLDGQPDINSEADLQAYFDSAAEGFAALRIFAKENKDQTIRIMSTDAMFQTLGDRFSNLCVVTQTGYWQYEYNCPSPTHALEIEFSRADFEALQQMAAGNELYLSMYNSYDIAGTIDVALSHEGQAANLSAQTVLEEVLKDPKFGQLRAGNGFQKIRSLGVDAISAIRWMMANQSSLCPMGLSSPRNRVGSLIDKGFCITSKAAVTTARDLKKIEGALAGDKVQVLFYDQKGVPYRTDMSAAIIDRPVADLHLLAPVSIGKCGYVNSIADETGGGLFPNKDANKVLKMSSRCPN
ncbi:MAG: hypothetical protein V4736_12915 [Bdellovibrionota bacterium]